MARGWRWRVTAWSWSLLCVLGVASPAAAHPLGLPALVGVTSPDGELLELSWQAAPDDLGALFREVGHEVDPGAAPSPQQLADGAGDPALRGFVAAHLRPVDDACALVDVDVGAPVTDGITTTWRCPPPDADPTRVEVEVSLLTGADPRYRTLVYGSGAPDDPELTTSSTTRVVVAVEIGAPDPTDLSGAAGTGGATGEVTSDGLLARVEREVLAAIDGDLGAIGLLLAFAVAFAAGGLHGLAPGHGKAIAGAYLIGERGRPRHAVLLGGIVAAMHTGSTLALGVFLVATARRDVAASLDGWFGLLTGVVVLALGGLLVRRRLRDRHSRAHAHDHTHPHGHDHTHGGPDAPDPLSWRGIAALGAAGGLLPSPTALLVVITAAATDRMVLGLSLVGAFSVGLAGTVTAAGLAVLWGRDRLASLGRGSRLAAWLHDTAPLVGAVAVTLVGIYLVSRAATVLVG